ncbi:bifunctional folylpolyglutamate synthase/dihydrofolate synthase [Nitrosophilus alvini]|uniref:bifunctional folylpolyglutamate synthase/dihydrofolate synthase n=1 Tax=Nitrosophilus alvini TaxID=2714855 RepID=UPI00190BF47F|nr:Mur ligase family protein [Nitrosophilus alvini]
MKNLQDFLAQKPLYYKKIDLTRMPKAYESVKDILVIPKIIHIVGTNGKGSTGRFLAHMLHKKGFKTGHYTSPHIVRFNERIWLEGKDVSDETLENAHIQLQKTFPKKVVESLSYFEYTTFLAMKVFEDCDYVVLEAGLGGEYDATNVFRKVLSLFTPIAYDHQAFLGEDIESIAKTKLRSMDKRAIIGYQKYKKIYDIAEDIAKQKGTELKKIDDFLTESEKKEIEEFIKETGFAPFFAQNCQLAAAAFKALGEDFEKELLKDVKIRGRMEKIAPNITIDVGHNPLAAEAIKTAVKKNSILVYNSFEDKDCKKVLSILKPVIKRVEILEIPNERAVDKELLVSVLNELDIDFCLFDKIDEKENYLVFGSFSVVEEFLRIYEKKIYNNNQ